MHLCIYIYIFIQVNSYICIYMYKGKEVSRYQSSSSYSSLLLNLTIIGSLETGADWEPMMINDDYVWLSKITICGLKNLLSICVHKTHRLVLNKAWLKGHIKSRNIMHTYILLSLFLTAPVLVLIIFKITRTRILRTQDRVVFIRSWALRIRVLVTLIIIRRRTGAVRNSLTLMLREAMSPL
jgi:hypothetical protein